MELISLESLLEPKPIVDAVYGIGNKYKRSREALYEKEPGNEKNDVEVVDRIVELGTTITFVWNRGKSNQNVTDTRDGKLGFSFYYARYAYADPYKIRCDTMKKRTDGRIEYLAHIRRLGQEDDDENPMIIVQAEPDSRNNNKIRIITAYYTENPKLLVKYLNHYKAVVNSHNKEVTDNYTFEGTSPEQLKEMWDEYKARQLAWEEANNHKDI